MPVIERRTEASHDDEGPLITAAVAGDRAAFSRLYQRYVGRIYRYLYSRIPEQAEAEDLTSQTFLRALNALPRYRHRGHFAAWLFAIAHRLTIDHFRRVGTRRLTLPLAEAAATPDPASDLASAQQQYDLACQLRSLSPQERELLRLRYVADLTHDEIGRVLHRSEGAVKKSLYRILARLQRQMEGDHV